MNSIVPWSKWTVHGTQGSNSTDEERESAVEELPVSPAMWIVVLGAEGNIASFPWVASLSLIHPARAAAVSHYCGRAQEVIFTLLGNLDRIHCCFPFILRINEKKKKPNSSECQICVPV